MTISLHRDLDTGIWLADQIETRVGGICNTTRFTRQIDISEAFCDRFLSALLDLLPKTLDQQVYSLTGEVIRLASFTAHNARVLTQSAHHGIQRVIIRFTRVLGRVFEFLAPSHRPDVATVSLPQDEIPNDQTPMIASKEAHDDHDEPHRHLQPAYRTRS
mgnify:CR=1 FL=1